MGVANASVPNNTNVLIQLKIYYAFLLLSQAFLLILSLEQVHFNFTKAFKIGTFVCLLIVIAPLAGSNYFDEYRSIGYSVTHVPGDHYGIIRLFILITAVTPCLVFTYGVWVLGHERCKSLLNSSVGILVVLLSVAYFMNAGYNLNAAGFLSMATTIFVLNIAYTESKAQQFLMLSGIPGTRENRLTKRPEITELLAMLNGTPSEKASPKFALIHELNKSSEKEFEALLQVFRLMKSATLKEAEATFRSKLVECRMDNKDQPIHEQLGVSTRTLRRIKNAVPTDNDSKN